MKISDQSARYSLPCDNLAFDALFEVVPRSVCLDGRDIELDARLIRDTASRLFLIDDQRREIIRRIIGAAEALSKVAITGSIDFNRRLMSIDCWAGLSQQVLCVSGLAGVGKSALVNRINEYLISQNYIVDFGSARLATSPLIHIKAHEGGNFKDFVSALDDRLVENHPYSSEKSRYRSTKSVRTQLFRDCTFLILGDELQEMTASSTASSQVTKFLLQMGYLGPVFVFCCNYSLLHKLATRNQEDRDRILSHRLILRPSDPCSPDWTRYLDTLVTVFEGTFQPFSHEDIQELHGMTFGIHRKLIRLFELGYRLASGRFKKIVCMDHLRQAFSSSEYAVSRHEIQKLHQQVHSGRGEFKDLHSPFDPLDGLAENSDQGRAKLESHRAQRERVETLAQEAAQTRAERLSALASQVQIDPVPRRRVRSARPKRQVDDLLHGASVYNKIR